jgi:hypothetical protein
LRRKEPGSNAGVKAPEDRHRVGQSYAALRRGKKYAQRDAVLFEYSYVRCIRTNRWKSVMRTDGWPAELFDLKNEPGERKTSLIRRRAGSGGAA